MKKTGTLLVWSCEDKLADSYNLVRCASSKEFDGGRLGGTIQGPHWHSACGSQSISFDVSFHGAYFIYGILDMEHASTLLLLLPNQTTMKTYNQTILTYFGW